MSDLFAKSLRITMTEAESHLWYLLRDRRLCGYKFRRQMPIKPYIADFVCLSARLIVEIDGGQHSEQAEKDKVRDAFLRSQGFTVLRFWNNEVFENTQGVLERVLDYCNKNSPHPSPSPARGEGFEQPSRDQLRRLRWRCRRGLLELDVWLEAFAASGLNRLSPEDASLLECLLEESDTALLEWLQQRTAPPAAYADLLQSIRAAV